MEVRGVSPEELKIPGPKTVDAKNQSKIEPLGTPDFYANHFDGRQMSIPIAYNNGEVKLFEIMRRVDDPQTGMSAVVMHNRTDGHAVIMYKGTDLPGRDEGAGRMGFMKDIDSIMQARRGEVNQQTAPAEKVYLDTLKDPQVKSVEIIGYSIGSQHLNYMAAKHGARGTAIADMGMPTQVLTSVFNKGMADSKPAYSLNEISQSMRERVTVLHLDKDKLPQWASAGPSLGTQIALDAGSAMDWKGLLHVPQVYGINAGPLLEAKEQERQRMPVAIPTAPGPS